MCRASRDLISTFLSFEKDIVSYSVSLTLKVKVRKCPLWRQSNRIDTSGNHRGTHLRKSFAKLVLLCTVLPLFLPSCNDQKI